MPQEKIRVYALARELNLDSKVLVDICREANIEVRNQLSSLEPEQRDLIVEMVRRGGSVATAAPPPPQSTPEPKVQQTRVRNLKPKRTSEKTEDHQPEPVSEESPPQEVSEPEPVEEETVVEESVPEPVEASTPEPAEPAKPATDLPRRPRQLSAKPNTLKPKKPAQSEEKKPVEKQPEEKEAAPPVEKAPVEEPKQSPPPPPAKPKEPEPPRSTSTQGKTPKPMRNLDSPRSGEGGSRDSRQRKPRRPGEGRSNVRLAQPPPLKPSSQQSGAETEEKKKSSKSKQSGGVKKLMKISADDLKGGGSIFDKVSEKVSGRDAQPMVDEDDDGPRNKKGGKGVPGRGQRHRDREERGKARRERRVGLMDRDGGDDERRRGPRRRDQRKKRKGMVSTKPRNDSKIPVEVPITVRSLSEALGVPAGEIVKVLMSEGQFATINDGLEPELAETIALGLNFEIEIKRAPDLEEQLLIDADKEDDPELLQPRAPIVTVMGHVDHGKTSLLDRIRESNVVDSEVGGITQSIRAWRVTHDEKPITFLDTPGHEAFTQMRARGANVTDIAVIVVAADDGIMPQTEEAINHAKAAEVKIVVAINKIDLPNANIQKTEQQLYGMELIPDTMGGDTPFVYTSAATGEGIDELLENISLVAELEELTANPDKPAQGLCLEASVNDKEGVTATILVEEGTLKRNDVILCGSTYGNVRAMFDDLGRPLEEAGPSVPVRVLGLDDVPNADDPFYVVPDIASAGKIAEKRRKRDLEESQTPRGPMRLEDLSAGEVAELKVILKADVKGSLEAIKKELDKLQHDEVRVKLLMSAVGGISENDVNLALTAPESTIIVGFNVVPDDRAMALAEEKGIQIRQYIIIYNLTDDIRSALEGKLKPREEVIHLGRAVVRQTFKISRTGTIAGCYVTQGQIERSALIRVIRNGVVVYPPADKEVGLDSLKRHKDDAREVKQGFECGIKITGYDDIKVDDVLEAYRIDKIQRTLDE